jgi:hypothetical protein
MSFESYQKNWQEFLILLQKIPASSNESLSTLIENYKEQNLSFLNEVFAASVENLKKLQNAKSTNEVICTQARFSHEITQKLALSTQRFLNTSLGQVDDYNEWLKAHCDAATD